MSATSPQDRRRLIISVCLLLCVLALSLFNQKTSSAQAPDGWQWITCDVGQGDAHLVRTVEGQVSLIDTGDSYSDLEACLEWAQVERLDAVFITHQHRDHYGALNELAESYPIARLFTSAHFDPAQVPQSIELTQLASSDEYIPELSLGTDTEVRVLWPPDSLDRVPGEKGSSALVNNSSLVLHFRVGGEQPLTVLTTGDLEEAAAGRLLPKPENLEASILKVAHHGSRGSGTQLIGATNPALALISAGRGNDYGHPHQVITDYLKQHGVSVVRTDQSGSIALEQRDHEIVVTLEGQ